MSIFHPHPDFDTALDLGRPPNIKTLFPHSRALIVSGKFIDRALTRKGHAMTIAANGRNFFVLEGVLMAAPPPPPPPPESQCRHHN